MPKGLLLPGLAVVGALIVCLLVVVGGAFMPGAAAGCKPGTGSMLGPAASIDTSKLPKVDGYSAEQIGNAAAIVKAAQAKNTYEGYPDGLPAHAAAIGIMTAIGESTLRVLDYGDVAGPDSRGLFQQRANGAWGSLSDRMNPQISATNFFKALVKVPNWENLEPTIAAHRTQINADPFHYQRFWADGTRIYATLSGEDLGPVLAAGARTSCDAEMITSGAVTWPIPASMVSTDNHNWGGGGANWSSWHTGTDFSVACGTPVYAATGGKVEVDTTQSWSGRWLVKVATGEKSVSTWYAHMQALTVSAGQTVNAGDKIGEVGSEGNSTGCHLHFEVHERNGSIYGEDNVNPSDWLKDNLGQKLTPATP